jgi:hypothetical protein
MLGASTAGYAVTQAGVAGLQSRAEADIAAARDPAHRAVLAAAAMNDLLGSHLDLARDQLAGVASAYAAAGQGLDELQADLGQLATVVGDIRGVSRSLPAAIQLPAVRAPAPATRSPSTHTTTRASGG